MKHWLCGGVALALALLLAACGQPVKSMFPPTVTVQQLRVTDAGAWHMQVRILNNSYGGMHFQHLTLTMLVDGAPAASLELAPDMDIPALSPGITDITIQPAAAAAAALAAIADQGSAGALPYSLTGTAVAIPEHSKKPRDYKVDSHDWLSAVPGVAHLFR